MLSAWPPSALPGGPLRHRRPGHLSPTSVTAEWHLRIAKIDEPIMLYFYGRRCILVVYFHTKRLQKVCGCAKDGDTALGEPCARRLRQRLAELRAAGCLADISRLPPARCHELTADRAGQLSVDLKHPRRLLFIPANIPVPLKPDGGLDWGAVTEIEIIEIADTH